MSSIWKMAVADLKRKNPSTKVDCPITECKLYNISIDNPGHALWPSGVYKNIVDVYNDEDEKLFQLTYSVLLKSIQYDNF